MYVQQHGPAMANVTLLTMHCLHIHHVDYSDADDCPSSLPTAGFYPSVPRDSTCILHVCTLHVPA